MPIFKFFVAEPEGVVLPALLFDGAGDFVMPIATGTFVIPSEIFAGVQSGFGVFDIPGISMFGSGVTGFVGAGDFVIPAIVAGGTGELVESSSGVFEIPSEVFSGTAAFSAITTVTGEFLIHGLLFAGTGVKYSIPETTPDEEIDVIVNLSSGVRFI